MKAAALLLVLSVPALAGEGYVRSTVKKHPELPLFLRDRCAPFHIGAAGSARTPERTEDAAIEAAFASWQKEADACGNGFTFLRGDDVPVVESRLGLEPSGRARTQILFRDVNCRDVVPVGDECEADPEIAHARCGNKYQCLYATDSTIGITLVSYRVSTGAISDTDIELNAAARLLADGTVGEPRLFTTVDGPACQVEALATPACVAFDVQNTMTHEIGHALGFDHVEDPASTMYASADFGETSKRRIDRGSARGFCEVYPRVDQPVPCDVELSSAQGLKQRVDVVGETGWGCGAGPGVPLALVALLALRRRGARST